MGRPKSKVEALDHYSGLVAGMVEPLREAGYPNESKAAQRLANALRRRADQARAEAKS